MNLKTYNKCYYIELKLLSLFQLLLVLKVFYACTDRLFKVFSEFVGFFFFFLITFYYLPPNQAGTFFLSHFPLPVTLFIIQER